MIRKTAILLPFFVFVALSNAAYSAENYASEEYVDDLFFEVIDYVDSTTTPMSRTMKTNDNQLFDNQVVLRDMLNGRDADDNWIKLDTEAQMAIPAINELHSEMAGKQDVITAENPLAAENVSGLSAVATTGSFNDLVDVPEIPSVEDFASDVDLENLRSALEAQIAEKQAAGDYLVADDLVMINTAISNLQSGKADVATVTALQTAIENLGETYAKKSDMTAADTALQNAINDLDAAIKAIDVTKYATIEQLNTKADKSALDSAVADLDAKIDQAVIDSSNIDLSSYAKTEDVANTYATKQSVESITTALADYATTETVNSELKQKANVADLGALAFKSAVSSSEIDAKAVTVDKIAGQMPAEGETLLMSVDASGNVTWLSVEILR